MSTLRTLVFAFSAIFLAKSVKTINKRILLNDPDLVNAKLQNLERKIIELETESNKLKQLNLEQRINGLENENSHLKQLVNTLTTSHSATFIQWGRKDCPSLNGTLMVYSGIAGGGAHDEKGSGANMLCLPHDPDTLSVVPSNAGAKIYGTEYQFSYKNAVIEDDVPCAVCQVTTATSTLMIPAKSSCPSGWLLQYNGVLVADYHAFTASEYVCLDSDPQYFEGRRASTDGNLFYPVVGVCGTLPCPSYVDGRVLPCVVCTK